MKHFYTMRHKSIGKVLLHAMRWIVGHDSWPFDQAENSGQSQAGCYHRRQNERHSTWDVMVQQVMREGREEGAGSAETAAPPAGAAGGEAGEAKPPPRG
eukprot:997758-Prorocentrum_minimum.AAC.1